MLCKHTCTVKNLPPYSATVSPQFNQQHDVLASAWEKRPACSDPEFAAAAHGIVRAKSAVRRRLAPHRIRSLGEGHRAQHRAQITRHKAWAIGHRAQGTGHKARRGGGEEGKVEEYRRKGRLGRRFCSRAYLYRQHPGHATEDSEGPQGRPHHRPTTESIVQLG